MMMAWFSVAWLDELELVLPLGVAAVVVLKQLLVWKQAVQLQLPHLSGRPA